MSNELSVIDTTVLTNEEKTELDKNIERIIAEHKENRQEINRLVFESVSAMTEADDAESELSNKGFFQRLIGGITGSNHKLQNKINSNRAAVQYASQQTLQKLAEQNLMSFDLITAVNNKLNASINSVNDEFKNIYLGLSKFLKYNKSELACIESRLAKVEQNVNLLKWQNSIEYRVFDGEEYIDMDNTKKMVCLVRDFYDITKGNWSTSDLLLLKTAMSTIGIQPRDPINYYNVLSEISHSQHLWKKLLGNVDIRPIKNPSYLISMGTLEKLNALENRESYIVDTVIDVIDNDTKTFSRDNVCDELTKNYLQKKANVDISIDVESYDLILDLLYNIKQAKDENLLLMSADEQDEMITKAEQLFLNCRFDESIKLLNALAENDNPKAMYLLGKIYHTKKNYLEAAYWYELAGEAGYDWGWFNLATLYDNELGVYNDKDKAIDFYKKAYEANGETKGQCANMIGLRYHNKYNYQNANKWFERAGEAGNSYGWFNLATDYLDGKGFTIDIEKAKYYYEKACALGGEATSNAACQLGLLYANAGKYNSAKKWYRISANAGNIDAQNALNSLGVTSISTGTNPVSKGVGFIVG